MTFCNNHPRFGGIGRFPMIEDLLHDVVVAPIVEELVFGSFVTGVVAEKTIEQVNKLVIPAVNKLLDRLLGENSGNLDLETPGVARTVAFLVFSVLVSGPLFSAMHGINTLHHSRIWGRVVVDDVFRRFGIRGAILVHMLTNLLGTFQGSDALV